MQIEKGLLAVLLAYFWGSIPTALLYSRWAHGQDIRCLGDGNMGARNSKRQFGWRAGVLVALADIVKGALAVQVAGLLGLPEVWHFLCGFFAVLGHDSDFCPLQGWTRLCCNYGGIPQPVSLLDAGGVHPLHGFVSDNAPL